MAERRCAHEPCHCEPEAGREYCSPLCIATARAAQGTFPASYCPCGHPECRPENVSPDQPPPEAQP
jgi:hypothetical protein